MGDFLLKDLNMNCIQFSSHDKIKHGQTSHCMRVEHHFNIPAIESDRIFDKKKKTETFS